MYHMDPTVLRHSGEFLISPSFIFFFTPPENTYTVDVYRIHPTVLRLSGEFSYTHTHTQSRTQTHNAYHAAANGMHCVYTMHTALRPRQKRPLTATHCNTLPRAATCYQSQQHTATRSHMLPHAATHTLQHAATHCHTLQHAATHCNTQIYAATWRHTRPKEDQDSTAARI